MEMLNLKKHNMERLIYPIMGLFQQDLCQTKHTTLNGNSQLVLWFKHFLHLCTFRLKLIRCILIIFSRTWSGLRLHQQQIHSLTTKINFLVIAAQTSGIWDAATISKGSIVSFLYDGRECCFTLYWKVYLIIFGIILSYLLHAILNQCHCVCLKHSYIYA